MTSLVTFQLDKMSIANFIMVHLCIVSKRCDINDYYSTSEIWGVSDGKLKRG